MKSVTSFGRSGTASAGPRLPLSSTVQSARYIPKATAGLLGLLIAGLILQALLTGAINTTPSARTTLGGISAYLAIEQQQWWRLFTAPLFHRSIGHFLMNGLAIGLSGYFIERAWGWRAVILLFLVGAAAGSLFSLTIYTDIYANASGQAGALAVACVLASLREEGKSRRTTMMAGGGAALLALAALTANGIYGVMNICPLLGGMMSAFLLAPLFMKSRTDLVTIKNALLAILATFYAASLGASFWHHDYYAGLARSRAPDRANKAESIWNTDFSRLAAKYPKDPMPHLMLGMQQYALGDNNLAVSHLREGLRQEEFLQTQYMPIVRRTLRHYLVLALIRQGNIAEAKTVAGPSCWAIDMPQGSKSRNIANKAGVCS